MFFVLFVRKKGEEPLPRSRQTPTYVLPDPGGPFGCGCILSQSRPEEGMDNSTHIHLSGASRHILAKRFGYAYVSDKIDYIYVHRCTLFLHISWSLEQECLLAAPAD